MGMIQQQTYSASQTFAAPAGGGNTVVEINGFAAGSVQITGAWMESENNVEFNWERTSTLAVGASVADARVPHDPLNTVSLAGVRHFLLASAGGVLIGRIRTFNPGAAGAGPNPSEYRFGLRNMLSQPIVLRGPTDAFVLFKITGGPANVRYALEWNEDI